MKVFMIALLGFGLVSCGKEEIRSYSTPKAAPQAIQKMAEAASEAQPKVKAAGPKPEMLWDLPEGWVKEQGQKPMRVATLHVGTDDEQIEVVVSQLPSPVGTLLGNVNRWRRQVELEPLTGETFTELAKDKTSGFVSPLGIRPDPRLQGYLFDIQGKKDGKRMLVALMVDGFERTWFVKTSNTYERLQSRLDEFRRFVSTFRLDGELPKVEVTQDSMPLTWETPEGWTQESSGSGMITVAFVGTEKSVRTTAMALGGNGGGALPNLNRWRNQVGLGPVSKLADQASRIVDVDGQETIVFDLTGAKSEKGIASRIVVGMLEQKAQVWYFKMMGPSPAVEKNLSAFDALLASIRFVQEDK